MLRGALSFSVFDVHVSALKPSLGPIAEPTEVRLRTTGFLDFFLLKAPLSRV